MFTTFADLQPLRAVASSETTAGADSKAEGAQWPSAEGEAAPKVNVGVPVGESVQSRDLFISNVFYFETNF